jgi:hypothetical protein
LSPGVRNACVSIKLGAVLSGADRARLCLLGWVGSHFAMDRDRPGAILDGVSAPRVASHCSGRGYQCNYVHGGPIPSETPGTKRTSPADVRERNDRPAAAGGGT